MKINMQKSEIILVGMTKDVDRATSLFGCKLGKLTIDSLGPLTNFVVFGIQLRRDLKGN